MSDPSPDPPPTPTFASAVLVAAGRSTRMGGFTPKPLIQLAGRTVLEHSVAAFLVAPCVAEVVLVANEAYLESMLELARAGGAENVRGVVGGQERIDSVRAGVAVTHPASEVVLVHDAARPLVLPAQIQAVAELARREGAALLAAAVRDTLHRSPDGACAAELVDRAGLWAAQTPQGFHRARLLALLERAQAEGVEATDEVALHERWEGPVPIVPGNLENIKLTTPEDLRHASALFTARELMEIE